MSQVIITEQMQQLMDAIKQNPEVLDLTVSAVPEGLLIPEKLINPLQFTFRVKDPNTGIEGDAFIIVPETIYNNPIPVVEPSPIGHLLYAITFDVSNLKTGQLICFVDPDTMKVIPVAGFDPEPIDIATADPMLQSLATKILALPGVVRVEFHNYIDPDLKDEFMVTDAYRFFAYFDNFPAGRDNIGNISTVLRNDMYLNEASHDVFVQNILNLIQQKRSE